MKLDRLILDQLLKIDFFHGGIDMPIFFRKMEEILIERALNYTGWDKAKACRLLNIKRTTLHMKLKVMGLKTPERFQKKEDLSYW